MPEMKIKINGDASGLKGALNSARNGVKGFAKSVKSGLSKGALLGGGFIAGIVAMGVAITKIGADFESTSVAFGTMLRSGDKATAMLDRLTEFSTKTPFEPKEVFSAAKTLLAFGASAEEVHGIIATIGDVSSATGKDLNELARIYGKVFVKGKIQAEELNQLSEAGVPIIGELKKQYGATAEEIFKMGSQGKLSFNDMDKALKSLTGDGGIFFNAMAAQSETFNGKMSTLMGNLSELGRSLSRLKFPKELLDNANKLVKLLASELSGSGEFGAPKTFIEKVGVGTTPIQQLATGKAFDGRDAAAIAAQGRLDVQASILAKKKEKAAEADKEAEARKKEAAARIGTLGQSGKMLSPNTLGGGGTLASLGGDISGGGFSARVNIQQDQLNATIEIRDLTRAMVRNSTRMNDGGLAAESRQMAHSAIKD